MAETGVLAQVLEIEVMNHGFDIAPTAVQPNSNCQPRDYAKNDVVMWCLFNWSLDPPNLGKDWGENPENPENPEAGHADVCSLLVRAGRASLQAPVWESGPELA